MDHRRALHPGRPIPPPLAARHAWGGERQARVPSSQLMLRLTAQACLLCTVAAPFAAGLFASRRMPCCRLRAQNMLEHVGVVSPHLQAGRRPAAGPDRTLAAAAAPPPRPLWG